MSTWAVGDIQGCWTTFSALLECVRFDPKRDELWLTGDLVNRGRGSLEVLRWCVSHAKCVTAVLGNHDLHLLARAERIRAPGRRDSLEEVLAADDRADLLSWLRSRPLFHRDRGFALVHAGLLPQWSLKQAHRESKRASKSLRKEPRSPVLARPSGQGPLVWSEGSDDITVSVTALTTLRCVTTGGAIMRRFTGPPEKAPKGAVPWFDAPAARWRGSDTVLFGHWAALGHRQGDGWVSLDSGCVWGGSLTAYRLEDGTTVRMPSQEAAGTLSV